MDELEPIGTIGTTLTVDHIRAAMERLKREPTEYEYARRDKLERAMAEAFDLLYERYPDLAWRAFVLANLDG